MKAPVRPPRYRLFMRALGIAVGAVFVFASLSKIAHPDRFADFVRDYEVLPLALVNTFALVLPWMELVTGGALILGVWRRAAGLVAAALCVTFMVAIVLVVIPGRVVRCGCFDTSGLSTSEVGWGLFLRDAGLLMASGWVWRRG